MTHKISKSDHAKMQNLFIQFFKFIYLNFRIIKIVAGGHGSTRE
jgi:hypothetical protein